MMALVCNRQLRLLLLGLASIQPIHERPDFARAVPHGVARWGDLCRQHHFAGQGRSLRPSTLSVELATGFAYESGLYPPLFPVMPQFNSL